MKGLDKLFLPRCQENEASARLVFMKIGGLHVLGIIRKIFIKNKLKVMLIVLANARLAGRIQGAQIPSAVATLKTRPRPSNTLKSTIAVVEYSDR